MSHSQNHKMPDSKISARGKPASDGAKNLKKSKEGKVARGSAASHSKTVSKTAAKRPEKEPKPTTGEAPEPAEAPIEEEKKTGQERYWEGVGRRKTAVARVRLYTRGEKGVWVNGKPAAEYFPYANLEKAATLAIETMKSQDRFRAVAKVRGGGIRAQAEAVSHGSARALVLFNADFRKRLKREGLLTRDPRMTERKKFGLKKARRAPQWAKR